jgi:hypothetical protein
MREEGTMIKRYLRVIVILIVLVGIALLARGQVAWAGQDNTVESAVVREQNELNLLAGPGPGSVQPPPTKFSACKNGFYSIGGVVTLEIKDLKPKYCIEALLWNRKFQIKRIPDDAGKALADFLLLKVYYSGRLVYELPATDGTILACYAIPPKKQAQFFFYDFYGKHFDKRTEPPRTWDILPTAVDTEKKIACAFTQVSGVYGLIGK